MKQRGFIAAIAAAALITGAAVSAAYGQQGPQRDQAAEGRRGPGGPGGPGGRMGGPGGPGGFGLPGLRELDLSDTQKEQIRTIQQSHRDQVQQIGERTRTAQRAIDQAANGTAVDEAAIRTQSTALAAAIADGAILRAKVNAEIFNLLTAEQQQKLNEFRAQRRR
jgi:Spy/CpxP family protein refolding chaperone